MKPTAEEVKNGANKKKFSKPLMERRRRARINESLNELKSLVLTSLNKDHSKFNKMEKADVLELTVSYLKSLKSKGVQQANDVEQQQHFAAGYNECAREVQMYLLRSNDVSPQVKARMLSHISASPPDINATKPSMNYPMKREEHMYKANNTFPPLISVYPSPPSSPTGLGHVRMNLKSSTEPQWVPMSTSNDNRSVNTTERKDDSSSSQDLWRPWQSA